MAGKLQIRRGTQVPAQLAAGEPFFDGEDLHIGKIGGGGNKKIGGSTSSPTGGSAATLVEWPMGDDKPTVEGATRQVGEFFEGKMHVVTTHTVGEETVAVVQVENWVEGFNPPVFDGRIRTMAVDAGGNICIGGEFTNHIAELTLEYIPHPEFGLTMDHEVRSVNVDLNYGLIVGGGVSGVSGFLKRINGDFSLDTSFNQPALDKRVNVVLCGTGGAILIGGEFTGGYYRLLNNGIVDEYFAHQKVGEGIVNAISFYDGEDGCIIGGQFDLNKNVQKINYDGTIDEDFAIPTFDGAVYALVVTNDLDIVVGGAFTGGLAKYDSLGNFIDDFDISDMGSTPSPIVRQLFRIGPAQTIVVVTDTDIFRLFPDGGFDGDFSVVTYPEINSVADDLNGYLVAAVTDADGVHKMVRIDTNGNVQDKGEDHSFIGDLIKRSQVTFVSGGDFVMNEGLQARVFDIAKAGEYVFAERLPGESMLVRILYDAVPKMAFGDKIKIYFSPYGQQGDTLQVEAFTSNYTIGQPLQEYSFCEFAVMDAGGTKALYLLYASHYMGQAT